MMTIYLIEICGFSLLIHSPTVNSGNTKDPYKKCTDDDIPKRNDNYYVGSVSLTVVLTMVDGTFHNCMGIDTSFYDLSGLYVLTSASCLDHEYINYIQVFVSCVDNNTNALDQDTFLEKDKRMVVKIAHHPKYDKITHLADVALIRVDRPFEHCSMRLSKEYAPRVFNRPNDYSFRSTLWNLSPAEIKTQIRTLTPYFSNLQTVSNLLDQNECPPPKESSETLNVQKQFWYLFFCSKVEKDLPLDGSGSILTKCRRHMRRGLDHLEAMGVYTYSYPLNDNEQVAVYTVLYWYIPWIFYISNNDRLRPLRDDDVFYGIYPKETTTSPFTKLPVRNYTDMNDDLYYNENTAYDDIPMGPNPNGATIFPRGRSRIIITQIGLFLSVVYKTYFLT